MIALYKRNANTSAPFTDLHERFYYHNAGLAGGGGSMYIDSVIMRDDTLTSGTLSRTMLYAQNWRGDVVGMLRYDGSPYEHVRYSAYGRPVGISPSDWDGDGVQETADIFDFLNDTSSWADYDLDGVLATADIFAFLNETVTSGGRDKLHSGSKNRIGYAGYQHDDVVPHMQLARHRWYRADLKTWTRRDPLGEVDGPNLYGYVAGMPLTATDAHGLLMSLTGGGGGGCEAGGCEQVNGIRAISGQYQEIRAIDWDNRPYPGWPNRPYPGYQDDPSTGKYLPRVCETMCASLSGCFIPGIHATNLAEDAHTQTLSLFGQDGLDSNGDAFRHCYWSCRMSSEPSVGPRCAQVIGDCHEKCRDPKSPASRMDRRNNAVGRAIGKTCEKSEDAQGCCFNACYGAAIGDPSMRKYPLRILRPGLPVRQLNPVPVRQPRPRKLLPHEVPPILSPEL